VRDTTRVGKRFKTGERGADRRREVHIRHAHVHRRVRVERADRQTRVGDVQDALESDEIEPDEIGRRQRLGGRQVDDDHPPRSGRGPELGEITLDGADELARRLARDDGGREPHMLLAGGQLVFQQADQVGREGPDVAAERVRRLDQRCVEDIVAAEDERVERSQSGCVERVALGDESDGACVTTLEREGADDGRGGHGTTRANEPHTEWFVDGSPLIGRHARISTVRWSRVARVTPLIVAPTSPTGGSS